MPRYSPEQIYGFARQAGFSPDEAATMTAIALAESGGNSRAHNPVGEDSKGLWQINGRAHPGLNSKYDLYDPLQNAKAAYEVSRGGEDVSPWTVTHGLGKSRYLRYRDEAEAAAVAYGDGPGHGVWTGTPGYGHRLDAGDDAGAAVATTPVANPTGQGGNASLTRFLEVARAQVGDRYVFGAEVDLDNPDPNTFDCSEFTQWATHQAGGEIPDGASAQYRFLKEKGMVISVEEAKRTPGALLFHFDVDPFSSRGEVKGAHVAISTGDGRTVEAANSRVGVVERDAGSRFQYAAVIPGISDGTATPLGGTPPAAVPPTDLAATPAVQAPVLLGGADADGDGLTDANERRLGLDPLNADTDGDNLPDGMEIVDMKTDAHQADTDGDKLNDAFELARGLDPTKPDTDGDGHLDGSFAGDQVDTDGDGLDDQLEIAMGYDPKLGDSDQDGFSDALEIKAHSNPLDIRSTPMDVADAQNADADDATADATP
ncbi:transglycosylase SLT domain-containing protein [Virgisporangium aliadipatigenens]|nr:transglycosylase SLT domain-containing protein [Virgisporangium aliadipatigenens]